MVGCHEIMHKGAFLKKNLSLSQKDRKRISARMNRGYILFFLFTFVICDDYHQFLNINQPSTFLIQ